MKAVAIVPARGRSARLPRKNVASALGKPLLAWVLEAALGCRSLGPGSVYVSTEDVEVEAVAVGLGAGVIARPAALAEDHVWTQPVLEHAVESLEAQGREFDLVVWLNASIPEVTSLDIERAIDVLIERDAREVIAVDGSGRSHSGVRVMRRKALSQRALSVHFVVMELDYVDVHTRADLVEVERRLAARVADRVARATA